MKLSCCTLSVGLLAVIIPMTASADSAALFGAYGGTAHPYMDQQIQLQSEKVTMTISRDNDHYQHGAVTVDYVFRNTSDTSVTMLTGFPERSDGDGKLKNFQASVRGKNVVVAYKKDDTYTDRPDEPSMQDGWYTYAMNFAPHEEVQVENTYEQDPWGGEGSIGYRATFEYILDTGATWKGTIDSVEVEINLTDDSLFDVSTLSPISPLSSNRWQVSDDWKKLSLTLLNIKPITADNIRISFDSRVNSSTPGCFWKVNSVDEENNPDDAVATSYKEIDRQFSFQPDDPNDPTNTAMEPEQRDMGYFPCEAFDGDSRSAWISGQQAGNPVLSLKSIPANRAFNALNILTGFRKDLSPSSYRDYSRPKKIKVSFFSPKAQEPAVSLVMDVPDNPQGSLLEFGRWIAYSETEGAKMDIKVIESYPGEKYPNVAIADVALQGIPKLLGENSNLAVGLNPIEETTDGAGNPDISLDTSRPADSGSALPELTGAHSPVSVVTSVSVYQILCLTEAIVIAVLGYVVFSKRRA
ncbi:MAG: hypothetical protein V1926_03115 [Candidatus Peregrinibacteria bacterium]